METELEGVLTHSNKEEMIEYLNSHPESFKEAIQLAITDKQPYSWRAAFLLWSCIDEAGGRMQGYTNTFIKILPDRRNNQQRELLKILQKLEIEDELEGLLFEHCVTIWKDISKQASVRYNALKILLKMAKKYPELTNEISFLTGSQYMKTLSAGARKSVSKIMKEFLKNSKKNVD
ncbi:MAG: hypothetical protein WC644_07660 [Ignavibacteria bacterium]